MNFKVFIGAAAALSVGTAAHAATNLVLNGGFEQSSYTSNTQFGSQFGGQGVTDWTGIQSTSGNNLQFLYFGGTETSVSATNQYGDPRAYFYPTFTALSPTGGNFIGMDGDPSYAGSISQIITGLVAGQTYNLGFDWAGAQLINRSGATTEQLVASLGGQQQSTNTVSVASGGFSGWMHQNMQFTATGSSEVLSFMAVGGPAGLPPIATLDSVTLSAVPEPTAWALMLMGFAGIGLMIRRGRNHSRRQTSAA